MNQLITDQQQFLAICSLIEQQRFVAVDTEFMRENTYQPILCLIQINVSNQCYVVDAESPNIDLRPFFAILNNPHITKIFHSSRQDISVLVAIDNEIAPQNILDTQIMSSLCGMGYDIGYATLAKKLLDKDLSKDWQRSDWQARPLHQEQIEYALIDVLYLPKIFAILKEKLSLENKLAWLEEEMQILMNKAIDDDLYKKFSSFGKNNSYQKNIELLVPWRDDLAKRRNVPRSFVIKDKLLDKIANYHPKNFDDLQKCGFESRLDNGTIKKEIIEFLQYQNVEINDKKINFKLNQKQHSLYQKSRELLQENALKHNVNAELIINQDDLKQIILGYKKIAKILTGWRSIVFGQDLEKLINNAHE